MPTITPTVTHSGDGTAITITWANLANGDDGSPIPAQFLQWADRSVQVIVNAAGAGDTIVFEGSNDSGSNYVTLTDPQGNALSFTGAGAEQVAELTELARPRVTGGDGTTDLTLAAVLRRAQPMRV